MLDQKPHDHAWSRRIAPAVRCTVKIELMQGSAVLPFVVVIELPLPLLALLPPYAWHHAREARDGPGLAATVVAPTGAAAASRVDLFPCDPCQDSAVQVDVEIAADGTDRGFRNGAGAPVSEESVSVSVLTSRGSPTKRQQLASAPSPRSLLTYFLTPIDPQIFLNCKMMPEGPTRSLDSAVTTLIVKCCGRMDSCDNRSYMPMSLSLGEPLQASVKRWIPPIELASVESAAPFVPIRRLD